MKQIRRIFQDVAQTGPALQGQFKLIADRKFFQTEIRQTGAQAEGVERLVVIALVAFALVLMLATILLVLKGPGVLNFFTGR